MCTKIKVSDISNRIHPPLLRALPVFSLYSFSSMILFSSPQPLLSVHHHRRVSNPCESLCKIKVVSNLDSFIHHGMIDCTSLICSNHNLHRFILRGMVDYTRTSGHEDGYFPNIKHLYGNIHKFIVFIHKPLYQTTVVYCNPVFHRSYLCMDRPTIFTRFPRKCGACSGSSQQKYV